MEQIKWMAQQAKRASRELAVMPTRVKSEILYAIAAALEKNGRDILLENEKDVKAAKEAGRPQPMMDRLLLTEARIAGMAEGMRQVAALADPVGEIIHGTRRPNGLEIVKKRVPLGVVGIIYEARPNVTADAMGLCIKTGNAVLLKGGSEAIHANRAIVDFAVQAGRKAGLPEGAVSLVGAGREAAEAMMKLNGYLDVLIPRGGAGLIQTVVRQSTVPVIETGVGNCHIYIDENADKDMAIRITQNAKVSRPSVCNAAESLLIHESVAAQILPDLARALKDDGVVIYGCPRVRELVACEPATEEDFGREYLDFAISAKVVPNVREAVSHINRYGTGHSECIVTSDWNNARFFQENVDAAAVYVNASTRFTDGGEFGFGAEIGISTQKLHARGPMGLSELTTVKYLINGDGQIR